MAIFLGMDVGTTNIKVVLAEYRLALKKYKTKREI